MLSVDECVLVVVDVQGKLAQLMQGREELFKNVGILIKAAKVLGMPILWCQQVPEALGETVEQIKELLEGCEPINKSSFSCCGSGQFCEKLRGLGRGQVVLCGIEAHVCIYQTAVDLVRRGYAVNVVCDAVSSRTAENREAGLRRMESEGAKIGSVEMVLFEILRTADHPKFRQIAKLVK